MSHRNRILFVCRENACRSQMAEGFARELGGGRVEAYSGGSQPRGSVNETAVKVMAERGIDLRTHRLKGLDELPTAEFDCVVTMGCGDDCPWVPTKLLIAWEIPDPSGKPIEVFRQVRDTIEQGVRELLQGLVGPAESP